MTTLDRWEVAARTALAERGIGYHEATPLIEDARAHWESGGGDPWEVLGAPEQFAADVAADRPDSQARLDTGGRTPGDYFSDAAFALAVLAVPAALLGAVVAGGFTIPVTVAGLVGIVLLAATMVAVYAVPGALRAAGHPRLAPWGFVLAAVLVVAGAVAFTQLPRTRVGTVPVLAVLASSLVAGWLLTRPKRAAEAGDETRPPEPEAWFRRLHDLLVGRFDVPSKRATELVAEARAHVVQAGTSPGEEFGPVARYARDLAEAEPERRGPWWRGPAAQRALRILRPVVVLAVIVDAAVDGQWWLVAVGVALLALLARDLLGTPRGRRAQSDPRIQGPA